MSTREHVSKNAVFLVFAVLAAPVLTSAVEQAGIRSGAASFRTVRGSVVAGDANASPLRRVRIVVTGATVVASPAYTDEQGRFEVVVPAVAAYELRLTKPGFAPLNVTRTVVESGGDLRFTLALGAAVTGRVTDQFGDPLLARARVRLIADASGRSPADSEWVAEADDLGEFRAGSLPSGRFEVTIDPPSPPGTGATAAPTRTATVVDVRPGEEATLNLTIEPSASSIVVW